MRELLPLLGGLLRAALRGRRALVVELEALDAGPGAVARHVPADRVERDS